MCRALCSVCNFVDHHLQHHLTLKDPKIAITDMHTLPHKSFHKHSYLFATIIAPYQKERDVLDLHIQCLGAAS